MSCDIQSIVENALSKQVNDLGKPLVDGQVILDKKFFGLFNDDISRRLKAEHQIDSDENVFNVTEATSLASRPDTYGYAKNYYYTRWTLNAPLVAKLEANRRNPPAPSLEEFGIKPGVPELFESNPELANAVYEALGYKTKANVILPIGTSGSGKSTFIKSLPQENLVVIEPDAMRVEFTGNINDKSRDKEIYEEAAKRAVTAIKQGKQVVFDTTNLTKDKRLPFIEAIKKAIPTANIQYKLMELNPELAKQRIKADITAGKNRANVPDSSIDRQAQSYNQMLEDIKSESISNFDLTPQQKQQAQQLYSQYLDTIFPDSKVKDIVYHDGGKGKIKEQGFKKDLIGISDGGVLGDGFYFYRDRNKKYDDSRSHTEQVLLNLKTPSSTLEIKEKAGVSNGLGKYEEALSILSGIQHNSKKTGTHGKYIGNYSEQLKKIGIDSIITNNEIMVLEPEQIHILGNQQDVEGFKEFVTSEEAQEEYFDSKQREEQLSDYYMGDTALMEQEVKDLDRFRDENSNMPDEDIDDYFTSCK